MSTTTLACSHCSTRSRFLESNFSLFHHLRCVTNGSHQNSQTSIAQSGMVSDLRCSNTWHNFMTGGLMASKLLNIHIQQNWHCPLPQRPLQFASLPLLLLIYSTQHLRARNWSKRSLLFLMTHMDSIRWLKKMMVMMTGTCHMSHEVQILPRFG